MGARITRELAENQGDCQLSPGNTARECRYQAETVDWNDGGIRPSPAPRTRTSIAVSPMRPPRKRAASAERESDSEPGGAWTGEWEKRCLITESNREGEVRGGGEGKEVEETQGAATGEKSQRMLLPSREEKGVASGSLALTRRLRAKAVVRKLERRVVAGRRGAPEISRGKDACGFPENPGASTTATVERKGCDRASTGETIGPGMPYNGDDVRFLFPQSEYLKSDEMTFNYALGS